MKHPLLLQIKQALQTLILRVSLGHVSAHIGIEENELEDSLSKEATTQATIVFSAHVPTTHVLLHLKTNTMFDYWDASTKGHHAHFLVPKVSRDVLIS